MVKDFSRLYLRRGNHYDFDTCHHGISPFAIIPLLAEAHREQQAEETALGLVSQTKATDHRKKRKYIPRLILEFNPLRLFLKCLNYWLYTWLGNRSPCSIIIKELENVFI